MSSIKPTPQGLLGGLSFIWGGTTYHLSNSSTVSKRTSFFMRTPVPNDLNIFLVNSFSRSIRKITNF